jgi:hypothetical protein
MKHSEFLDLAKLACGVAAIAAIAVFSLWRAGAIHLP